MTGSGATNARPLPVARDEIRKRTRYPISAAQVCNRAPYHWMVGGGGARARRGALSDSAYISFLRITLYLYLSSLSLRPIVMLLTL